MRKMQLLPTDKESRPWNALFSSLYLAEMAAARQANHVAQYFADTGDLESAEFYNVMALEESGHANLVQDLCGVFITPPAVALEIYAGNRCRTAGRANIVERLALVHLIFEPSALALLSFIQSEANNIFEKSWATEIRWACMDILHDEARHIRSGREYIARSVAELSGEERREIEISMKTHRVFLQAGLQRFFSGTSFSHIPDLFNERYQFVLQNSHKGVFHD